MSDCDPVLYDQDTEYCNLLCQNLADETERLIEDMRVMKDEALAEWSRMYQSKTAAIMEERRKIGGTFHPHRFAALEQACLNEYREGNARNLARAKHRLRSGDEAFVRGVERTDECFRRSISAMTDTAHREEHIKVRAMRREALLREWRIRKRELLDRLYEYEARSDKNILDDVGSLSYGDFCEGGRSAITGCFSSD